MAAPTSSSLALDVSAIPKASEGAVELVWPRTEAACPVLVASPHSGRLYEDGFAQDSCLSLDQLRRSEDAYVDELIASAPDAGATLVRALFPRVFVDPNRGPWELDPAMFADRLPPQASEVSRRAASGLGVIPRIGVEGRPLYRRRLRYEEAESRLQRFYAPYHDALQQAITALKARFGFAIVLDMHSMPDLSAKGVDVVLGDRFGTSCHAGLSDRVEAELTQLGFVTVRNIPYAGGYTTEHYGQPRDGVHVLQIEINRSLYMDERRVMKTDRFPSFETRMSQFINRLCCIDWAAQLQA